MTTEAQKRASEKYRLKHKEYYSRKSAESAKRVRMERRMYKERCEKASEYIKYNATSNYFDKDKNMFRREIDLLNILQNGSENQ